MALPDLEALAVFAVVADTASFTAAGVQMGLSKATVSKAVARLEQQLGTALFHRTSRQLSLTAAGERLLPFATRMLDEARAAQDAATIEQTDLAGPIRLGAPMGFGLSAVAPILPEFLRLYPGVTIELLLSDATIDLIGERLDATLRIAALPDSSLRARRLCTVGIHLVASPEFIAHHGMLTHPAALADLPCMAYSNAGRVLPWRFTGPEGASISVTPRGPLTVNSGEAMLPLLRTGQGIALLPDFIVREDLSAGTLVTLLPEWSFPPIALYFLTPPSRLRSARVQALADFFAKSLRN